MVDELAGAVMPSGGPRHLEPGSSMIVRVHLLVLLVPGVMYPELPSTDALISSSSSSVAALHNNARPLISL